MPRRVALSRLNATTIDILNTIRQNASLAYQSSIPTITKETDIPVVGEIIYGNPQLSNEFINALVNQIALVKINSATFNNAYAELKKGYLEFGETVEEVFVNIAKAREFSAEKAEARELKRTIPDVRSAFHAVSWDVQYPITIQDQDLLLAFNSMSGVQDLIAKIVDSVYRAAEYDEYLLFKYLIIKGVAAGQMKPVALAGSNMSDAAIAFRGTSNALTFMSTEYNAAGVHTNTPKNDQYIFMDSAFNAAYDVSVLASAFNMDKAEFQGKLKLIDSFTTFDNDRFDQIRAGSDMIEEVSSTELSLMADVKAVLVDAEWFQIYDKLNKMSEKYVASGDYWNYFYHVRKVVSSSPFSNAVVFVASGATTGTPASISFQVSDISVGSNAVVYTLDLYNDSAALTNRNYEFQQDSTATAAGIAVHKYGAVIMPIGSGATKYYSPTLKIAGDSYTTTGKLATEAVVADSVTKTAVGDTLTFTKSA